MNTQKVETYLINDCVTDVNNIVGNKANFIVAIIQPKNNEFKIEPYDVYQQYNGDFKKARTLLGRKLLKEGFNYAFP